MRKKIVTAIIAHAAQEYPRECCGVIAQKSRVERYFPCRNLAPNPEDNFVLCPEDYAAAEEWGPVTAIRYQKTGFLKCSLVADLTALNVTPLQRAVDFSFAGLLPIGTLQAHHGLPGLSQVFRCEEN